MKKFLRLLTVAAGVLASSTGIHAATTTLTFDDGLDTSLAFFPPLLTHGDYLLQGGYAVGVVSTKASPSGFDLVGALVDGSDAAATCTGLNCPLNNATTWLGMLNDGLPYVFREDGGEFSIKSMDASYIAAAGVVVPPLASLLRVYGFTADGDIFFEDAVLSGPVNGAYNFSTYTFSDAFAAMKFVEIDFYDYACNSAGSCNRTGNTAQFAIDNIVLFNSNSVPEPGSLALAGLAFAAAITLRRRRQAHSA